MGRSEKTIRYLLYVYIFLLPWQARWIYKSGFLGDLPWEFATRSIYATEVLLWVILTFAGIHMLRTSGFSFRKPQYNKKFFIVIPVFALVLLSSISILWAGEKHIALQAAFRLIEACALAIVLLNFHLPKNAVSNIIIAAGVLQSILSFWQLFSQKIFASTYLGISAQLPSVLGTSVVEDTTSRLLRAYGSLPHPNILGGFLTLGIILCLYRLLQAKKISERIIFVLCLALHAFALTITFSRGAWAASFIGICVLIGFYISAKKDKKLLYHASGVLLLAVISVILIFQKPLAVRLQGTDRLEQRSGTERIEQLRRVTISPLGMGIGNSGLDKQPVHNIYLLVLEELGVAGFAIFIYFCFSVLLFAWQNKNMLGVSLLVAVGTLGLFDHYLWTLYFGIMLFWLTMYLGIKKQPHETS